ncbi:hypothetical protein GCM10011579_050940 [Streptomyces albiflavescens]|uniref:Uncharacterized protein n=1 Tax=Streptomyces albiflavescens TaxID=1623582 RepID=A0A917Y8G9_9ACTN|nr:hypothetical protein GCM10011579_050940 [Streptomyces albiflavescens]
MLSACRAEVLDGGPPARAKPSVGEELLGLLSGAARVRAGRRDAAEIHQKPPRAPNGMADRAPDGAPRAG